MKQIVVLTNANTKLSDGHFADFASFLGAEVRLEPSDSLTALLSGWDAREKPAGLVLCAETLAAVYEKAESAEALRVLLLQKTANLFIYGVRAKEHDACVGWLSHGALAGVETVRASEIGTLPRAGQCFTSQLAATEFPRPQVPQQVDVFTPSTKAPSLLPLILVSGRPTFLALQEGQCTIFLATVSSFPDPGQPVTHESDLDSHYDALLPLLIFVRAACGEYCWRNDAPAARLTIDDPVLRRRYGYLDFEKLFDSLRRNNYGATVAFIPWNCFRTSNRMAPFFRREEPRFSICVHGCDHTRNEFGVLDETVLLHKSILAMDRMTAQESRTHLGFERVMIFPQGLHSTASLRAIRSSDKYLAVLNTSPFPVDEDGAPISLAELLLPASVRSTGFPVFGRHYVTSTFPFCLDLFLGRPAFIIEHHEFFKDGFPQMEALARHLNECEPNLSWAPLEDTLERACWKRALSPDQYEVRFFTSRFLLTNKLDRPMSYRLFKDEPNVNLISAVLMDGLPVPFERGRNRIDAHVRLSPGQTVRVQLQMNETFVPQAVHSGVAYSAKVFVRRALSEFRDEVLIRSPLLLAMAKRFVTMFKKRSSHYAYPAEERLPRVDRKRGSVKVTL